MEQTDGSANSVILCLWKGLRRPRWLSKDPWVGKVPWRRKWQPTPVFLPGKPHGQRSLAGYSSEDHKELFTTEHTHRAEYIRGHTSVQESSGSV